MTIDMIADSVNGTNGDNKNESPVNTGSTTGVDFQENWKRISNESQ
jgi:hypothetical protein